MFQVFGTSIFFILYDICYCVDHPRIKTLGTLERFFNKEKSIVEKDILLYTTNNVRSAMHTNVRST
mgnify:CR=1 FL=1